MARGNLALKNSDAIIARRASIQTIENARKSVIARELKAQKETKQIAFYLLMGAISLVSFLVYSLA